MAKYIYQQPQWTNFLWEDNALQAVFGEVRLLQGKIIGRMHALGFSAKEDATLHTLTLDVVKTSEIEGELLDHQQVRSSIAKRLGINTAGMVSSNQQVEGTVDMMLDATQRYAMPLTKERLFAWHAALFPSGTSVSYKIEVGMYRTGVMRVVPGALGKEKVHFEAVPPDSVLTEMDAFLVWFNEEQILDPVFKAAIAHFWFIIIHPFDDGNGRIARAISDMLLARAEQSGERFYSMSSQILVDRKQYYAILQKVQHSAGDITEWLAWFFHCLKDAMLASETTSHNIQRKAEFWHVHEHTLINERQRRMINKIFDGFDGNLQSSKWAKICKISTDTALRDIKDLVDKEILQQAKEGGRNVHYVLTP